MENKKNENGNAIEYLPATMTSVSESRAFAVQHNLLDGQPRLMAMENTSSCFRFKNGQLALNGVGFMSQREFEFVEQGAGWVMQPYEEKNVVDAKGAVEHELDYSTPDGVYQFRHATAYRWVRYHAPTDQLFCQSFGGKNYRGIAYKNNWVPFDGLDEHGQRKLKKCNIQDPWIVEIVNKPEFASTYVCHWLAMQGSLKNAKISLGFCIPELEGMAVEQQVRDMFSQLFGYILTRQVLEESEGLYTAGVPGEVLDIVEGYTA